MNTPQMPVAPKMPEPVRIAAPDDPDLLSARRKKLREEFGERQGRESTVLSGRNGTAYSRTTLG